MNWVCPFCQKAQFVIQDQRHTQIGSLCVQKSKYKRPTFSLTALACSNAECGEIELAATFGDDTAARADRNQITATVQCWQLRPFGAAKPQAEYIKNVIYEDYAEACAIRDLSPKAAATLIRRCLQGMVRDFCGISKPQLIAELNELSAAVHAGNAPPGVSLETVEAIDAVREIGNIGAHMERDVDVVVPVDPDEVTALIELVEMLFDDWYGQRHQRQRNLERLKGIAAEKKLAKKPAASRTALPAPVQTSLNDGRAGE